MIHRRRFSATLCFVISLGLAILVALLGNDVFAMDGRGHSMGGSANQPTMDQIAVLQKIDPECDKYDRCAASLDTVFGTINISSFQEKLTRPSDFRVSGDVSFTWIPEAYPDWNPKKLAFVCRVRDCNFPGWTSVNSFRQGPAEVWTANFTTVVKESTSFRLYPFDQHWVHMKLVGKDALSQTFISMLDVPELHVEISGMVLNGSTSDFVIDYVTVSAEIDSSSNNLSSNILDSSPGGTRGDGAALLGEAKLLSQRNPFDTSSFAISLHAKRRLPAALWIAAVLFSQYPRSGNAFLGWRSDYSATGASALGVSDQSSFRSDQGWFLPCTSPD